MFIRFFGRQYSLGWFANRCFNISRKSLPSQSLYRLVMSFSCFRIYRRPAWVFDRLNEIRLEGHHFSFADGVPQPVGPDSRDAPKMGVEQFLVARYNRIANQHGSIGCKKFFISTS